MMVKKYLGWNYIGVDDNHIAKDSRREEPSGPPL
jgi:hypothetical protein